MIGASDAETGQWRFFADTTVDHVAHSTVQSWCTFEGVFTGLFPAGSIAVARRNERAGREGYPLWRDGICKPVAQLASRRGTPAVQHITSGNCTAVRTTGRDCCKCEGPANRCRAAPVGGCTIAQPATGASTPAVGRTAGSYAARMRCTGGNCKERQASTDKRWCRTISCSTVAKLSLAAGTPAVHGSR